MRHRLFNLASAVAKLLAWSYVTSFFLLFFTLMYIGRAGAPHPDALHTVLMTSHGRSFYLTPWQYHLYLGVMISVPVFGVLAVVTGAILNRRTNGKWFE